MTRAIALTGFDTRTTSKRSEQRMRSLNDAVEELYEMGYRVVSRQREEYVSWPDQRAAHEMPSFEAELKTLCGCTKRMFMQAPARPEIVIPVSVVGVSLRTDEFGSYPAPDVRTRRFRHTGYRRSDVGRPIFEYEEVP